MADDYTEQPEGLEPTPGFVEEVQRAIGAASQPATSDAPKSDPDPVLQGWEELQLRLYGNKALPAAPAEPQDDPIFGRSPLARELEETGWFAAREAEHAAGRERERQDAIRQSSESAWVDPYSGGEGELYPGQADATRRAVDMARNFGAGLMDPTQYSEFFRGIVPGAVQTTGTELRGYAGNDPAEAMATNVSPYMPDLRRVPQMSPAELAEFRKRVSREPAPATRNAVQAAISDMLEGSLTVEALERQFRPPVPISQRPLYGTGTAVVEAGRGLFPAAPGYETSVGRQLGEGVGSFANFLLTAPLGLVVSLARSSAMGSGESAERAIRFDQSERAAGRPGLTEEQIALATRLGMVPGGTDVLPLEILLHRWRLPVTPGFRSAAARVLSTIGSQFLIEGIQEGPIQQGLQNLISWSVYNPDQDITDDVLRSFGLGGGVGGIAGAGTEAARGTLRLAARRGGRAGPQPAPAQPAPETAAPQPAAPAAPPEAVQPTTVAPTAPEAPQPQPPTLGFDLPGVAPPAPETPPAAVQPQEAAPAPSVAPEAEQAPAAAPAAPEAVPEREPLTRLPRFEDAIQRVPKDAEGNPDVAGLQQRMQERYGVSDWSALNLPQRVELFRELGVEAREREAAAAAPPAALPPIPTEPEGQLREAIDRILVDRGVELTPDEQDSAVEFARRFASPEAMEAQRQQIEELSRVVNEQLPLWREQFTTALRQRGMVEEDVARLVDESVQIIGGAMQNAGVPATIEALKRYASEEGQRAALEVIDAREQAAATGQAGQAAQAGGTATAAGATPAAGGRAAGPTPAARAAPAGTGAAAGSAAATARAEPAAATARTPGAVAGTAGAQRAGTAPVGAGTERAGPRAAAAAQPVGGAERGVRAGGAERENVAGSDWFAEREQRVRASKAAGNRHLDDLPRYVESMRGVAFHNVHDPKERGDVRTVVNTGEVVVNWRDQYSADKNLVSDKVKDGRTMVWQSWLLPSDLRDYVVGDGGTNPTDNQRSQLRSIIASGFPLNWGTIQKRLGATPEQMEALRQEALKEGLLRQDKNGAYRRVPQGVMPSQAEPAITVTPEERVEGAIRAREAQTDKPVSPAVRAYAVELLSRLGFPSFSGVLEIAKADKSLSASDVRDLAAIAGYPVAKRATKATAFTSIEKRNADHKAFLEKQAAEEVVGVEMAAFASATSDGQSQRAELDALGFYSQALEAAKGLKQAKGTPEQMLSIMEQGAREAEIRSTKLDSFLIGDELATQRRSIIDRKSEISTLKGELGNKTKPPTAERKAEIETELKRLEPALKEAEKAYKAGLKTARSRPGQNVPASVSRDEIVKHLTENRVEVREAVYGGRDDRTLRMQGEQRPADLAGPARWSQYSLDPDNRTYRETVLHLGRPAGMTDEQVAGTIFDYREGHYQEVPGYIFHKRTFLAYDADSKITLVADEIQATGAQKIREGEARDEQKIAELTKRRDDLRLELGGLRKAVHSNILQRADSGQQEPTPEEASASARYQEALNELNLVEAELATAKAAAPSHPLVSTTDQWTTTAFRRLIAQAVAAGADRIAIVPAKVQLDRRFGTKKGMEATYDGIYPKNLAKILQKMDPSIKLEDVELRSSVDGRVFSHDITSKSAYGPILFHSFLLTEKVKEAVQQQGQALFSLVNQRSRLGPEEGQNPLQYTDAFATRIPEVVASIEGWVRKMLPPEVAVRVMDRIVSGGYNLNARYTFMEGPRRIFDRAVEIALTTEQGVTPLRIALVKAFHEVTHALREHGRLPGGIYGTLLTDKEWQIVVDRANKIGIDKQITMTDENGKTIPALPVYRKWYREQLRAAGFTGEALNQRVEELLNQERVANLAEQWATGTSFGAKIDSWFERIVKFVEAVGNALRGLGFQTYDDVFRSMVSGEAGRRPEGGRREPTFEPFPNTPSPAEVHLSSEEGQEARGLFPAISSMPPTGFDPDVYAESVALREARAALTAARAEFDVATEAKFQVAERLENEGEAQPWRHPDMVAANERIARAMDALDAAKAEHETQSMLGPKTEFASLSSQQPAPETRPFSIPGFDGSVTEKVKEGGERLRTYGVGGSSLIVSEQPDGSWELTFFKADDASRIPEIVAPIEQDIGKPISPRGWLTPQGYQYWLSVAPDKVKFHVNVGEMFGGMYASPRAVEFTESILTNALGEAFSERVGFSSRVRNLVKGTGLHFRRLGVSTLDPSMTAQGAAAVGVPAAGLLLGGDPLLFGTLLAGGIGAATYLSKGHITDVVSVANYLERVEDRTPQEEELRVKIAHLSRLKSSIPQEAFQEARREERFSFSSGPSLDMSPEARKARAEAMGFDTSRILYHGTRSAFDRFERIDGGNAMGAGFYFTESQKRAGDYAMGENVNRMTLPGNAGPNVIPVYLRINKPFDGKRILSNDEIEAIERALLADPQLGAKWQPGELASYFDRAYRPTGDNVSQTISYNPEDVNRVLRAAGYDSRVTGDVHGGNLVAGTRTYLVFDPSNIRSVNAAFDPSQEGSPMLLAALQGGGRPPPALPPGGPALPTTPTSQGEVRGLADIITYLKSTLGMTVTQGLQGMTVRDRAAGRTWRFRPQPSVRSQYDANAGVARIRISTDIDAIAREGGHHLERVFGAPLEAFKTQNAEELAAPPAPDAPLPTLNPTGFSGIDLDADTQRVLIDTATNMRAWQQMVASPKKNQAALYDVTAQAAVSASTLRRRLGRTIADALVIDLMGQTGRPEADYVRERYSATGTPTPRVAPTVAPAELSAAFADFFRRYITDPDVVKRDMPGVYTAFEEFLDANDPAMLQDLERVQLQVLSEDYKAYREATALEQLKADTFSDADQRLVTRLKDWYRRNRRPTAAGTAGAAVSEASDGAESLASVVYESSVDESHPWYLVTRQMLEEGDRRGEVDTEGRAISLAVHENPAKLIRSVGDAFKTGLRWIQDGVPNYRHGGDGFEVVTADGRVLGLRPTMAQAQALQATSTDPTSIIPVAGRRSRPLREALQLAMGNNWNYQSYNNFGPYLIARRAVEEWARYQRGDLERPPIKKYSDGQPANEIATLTNIIREFDQANPNFAEAARVVYDFLWQQAIHDFQAGKYSQAKLDYIASRKHYYVPYSRKMDDLLAQRGFGGRTSKRTVFAEDKRFEGSERPIRNPIEAIIDTTFHRAAATHVNEVIGAFIKTAERTGSGHIAERVTKTEVIEANNEGFQWLVDKLKAEGYDQHDAEEMVRRVEADFGDTHLLVTYDPTHLGPKRPILLTLYENGERQYIRVNDPAWAQSIYNSLNGIGRELTNLFIDSVAAPAALLRFGVTTNPAFIVPNIIRDMWSSWILTGGVNPRTWPIVTQIRGLYHELTQTDMARLYQEAAGLMGGQNVAALSKVMDKADVMALKEKGLQLKPVQLGVATVAGAGVGFMIGGPGGALAGGLIGAGAHRGIGKKRFRETMSYFSDMSETATRLGVFTEAYKAALAWNPNITPYQAAQEAAYVARDLIDFGRRGSKMLAAARLVPFMNAAIQGLDKAQRTLLARSDRGNAWSTTKLTGLMAAGAGAGFAVAGPVGGAAGTFLVPALATNLAARSAAVRALLAPFTKKDMGIPLSRDEERAQGQSAKTWANLLVYTLSLVAAGALFHWYTDDDDEYRRISPRMRFRNQPMKINGEWFMFPKAFEWAIPSNILEAAIESQYANDPRFWERVREGLYDNLAPPGVPQAVRMWGDISSNYDRFRDRPIVAEHLRSELPPELQFNAYASKLAIALSREVNKRPAVRGAVESVGGVMFGPSFELTPAIIDYVLRTGGGYWGADIQRFSNIDTANRVTDFPLIGSAARRFVFDPNRVSDALDRYWQLMGREHFGFRRAVNGYKRNNEMYGATEANQYLATLADPEQQAYALLEASETAYEKRQHPLNRLRGIVEITMDIERDLALERLADTTLETSLKPIVLSPVNRDEVRDALARIRAIEANNAMVVLQHRQFAGRDILAVGPALEILNAASSTVLEEYNRRIQRKHVAEFSDVQNWPQTRDQLLTDWREAMDKEAAMVRKPPKHLPIGASRPTEEYAPQ